jgi:hypothetical protein
MRFFLVALILCGIAAPAAAQCTRDTDCKGSRICVDGKCQDPQAKPSTPPPPPSREDAPPPPPPPGAVHAPKNPLVAIAHELAEKLQMPPERMHKVLPKLGWALNHDQIAKDYEGDGRVCVIAYQMGEGGFIVKTTKGKGYIQCLGATQPRSFTIKSLTFGAMIGGSSEWGVGVVLGIKDARHFGGEYKGSTRGATAGDVGISITELTLAGTPPPDRVQSLYLVGAAAGLTANAGGARLTLQLD